jgi:pyruvate dehydrogenase E1 component beta subunit
MGRMLFGEAIDHGLMRVMERDEHVIVIGEDVPMMHGPLYARFGKERLIGAPISEAAFTGAAVGAAMTGLRPVVEILLVDFVAVALDAVLNHMAKLETFSGGRWSCPLVLRVSCGGGYGDGGQHEQSLWGLLSGIPGLTVVVPSNPADAAGLMIAACQHDGPVVYLEHKLLSEGWLEAMGRGGRDSVSFDVPEGGASGEVPDEPDPVPIGSASVCRTGSDVTIASVAVGVHRSLAAAQHLEKRGVSCEVLDLRTTRPLDAATVRSSVEKTGKLVVVDEDYRECGLSGEVLAMVAETGATPAFRRVCLEDTLPYARNLEDAALPSVERIEQAIRDLLG